MNATTKTRIKKLATEVLVDILIVVGEKIAKAAKDTKDAKNLKSATETEAN